MLLGFALSCTSYAAPQITKALKISGKKPMEVLLRVHVKFRTEGLGQGCETYSPDSIVMVPLRKKESYEVNTIESEYSLDVPMTWKKASNCMWKVYQTELEFRHLTYPHAMGKVRIQYEDQNKKDIPIGESVEVTCIRKYMDKDGNEKKGISCKDKSERSDRWITYYNDFLTEPLLQYKVNIEFGELPQITAKPD